MPTETDPAKELALALENLRGKTNHAGDGILAEEFGVDVWSTEFYQIIFCLLKRMDDLKVTISALDMDDDLKKSASDALQGCRSAFTKEALASNWQDISSRLLSVSNINAIKFLSPEVRRHVKYPCLSPEERDELISCVNEMIVWLSEFQNDEQDFIRQSIIDGLKSLVFKLTFLNWLGWGYVVENLRDIISIYLALEKKAPSPDQPDAYDIMFRKLQSFLKVLSEKLGVAKEGVEKIDMLIRFYGYWNAASKGIPFIAGLLPHLPS